MKKDTISPKKILVVDDNHFIQYAMKIMLSDLNCEVKTADNGLDALIQLKKESFDLIFSDIHMPVMDGYELAKTIRAAKESYHDIPIIGVSSCTLAERKKALKVGMNLLFEKPIHPSVVRRIIFNLEEAVFSFSESWLMMSKEAAHLSHIEK